jgi:capsular polysaccharide biosynthesis protein
VTGKALAAPPASSSGQSVVTIGQFFAILRRRLVLLLVLVVLGVLAAGALLLQTPKTYQATTVVDISPTGSSNITTVSTITESRIVTSPNVAEAAKKTLAYTGTATDLASRVTVSSPLASQLLNITFAAGTAQGAADGANAFAHAYLDYRTEIAQKDITQRIGRIQSQVADLQKSLATLNTPQSDSQRGLLQSQIQQLENQLNTYKTAVVNPGHQAGDAPVPASASSPRPVLYLAGGVLFGLLVGIVLAVVRDRRDDRVRNIAELEHSLGAPVIAESSTYEGGSRPSEALAATAATRSPEADAYRTLTTAVTSHSSDSRVVLLCGTGHTGFSLAPLNLAATFAMQGLTTVIAGPVQAVEPAIELPEVQSLPSAQGARLVDQLVHSAQLPGLLVLSLGDEISLSATLRANDDSFAEILAKVDIIVLDGVNVELPSTSLRLGQIAEEAIVVAYKNFSTHAGIERLARQLAQVSVTVLGGLLLSRRARLRATLRRRGSNSAPRRSAGGAGHREADRSSPARIESYPAQAPEFGRPAGSATSSPAASTPVGSAPVGSAPVGSAPVGSAPVSSTPAPPAGTGSWPGGSFGSEAPPLPGSSRSTSARKG